MEWGFDENSLPTKEFLLKSVKQLDPSNKIFNTIQDKIFVDVPEGNLKNINFLF